MCSAVPTDIQVAFLIKVHMLDQDTQIHTNTQMQIHKYKYTNIQFIVSGSADIQVGFLIKIQIAGKTGKRGQ